MTALPGLRLQLHWLVDHPVALLNRDDHGQPKRLELGGVRRHRVSSAALKDAWKRATGHPWAIARGFEPSTSSRACIVELVARPLVDAGHAPEAVVAAVRPMIEAITGRDEDPPQATPDAPLNPLLLRQVLTLGPRETAELRRRAETALAAGADLAPAARLKAIEAAARADVKAAGKALQGLAMAGGAEAALFGRMTTGDLLSRMDSPLQVAHMLTTHAAADESDFQSSGDELLGLAQLGHTGSAVLTQSPLAGGIFYGYLCVDVPGLVANTTGAAREQTAEADREPAARLVERLVHLAYGVAPRARQTQHASQARADLMLLEITEGANRQLSSAFRTPSAPEMNAAARQLADSLAAEDAMSGCQDLRAVAATRPVAIPGATPTSLPALAATAARAVREAEQVARALPRPAHDGLALWA